MRDKRTSPAAWPRGSVRDCSGSVVLLRRTPSRTRLAVAHLLELLPLLFGQELVELGVHVLLDPLQLLLLIVGELELLLGIGREKGTRRGTAAESAEAP